MKKGYTDITFILDKSQSMGKVQMETIEGFNQFLKDQKEVEGEATFSLIMFDTSYNIIHNGINIQDVPDLNTDTYHPGNWTALLDAVSRGIDEAGKRLDAMEEDEKPETVIFVIQTDGEENSSKEASLEDVNKMITHQTEKYNWEFVFLGANQDAFAAGSSLGISSAATITYDHSSIGTRHVFAAASKGLSKRRMGDKVSGYFDKDDYDAQNDLLKDKGLSNPDSQG